MAAPSSWEMSAGPRAPQPLPKNSPYERGAPWAGAKCKPKGAQKPFSPSEPVLGAASVPGLHRELQGASRAGGQWQVTISPLRWPGSSHSCHLL